MNSEIRIAGAGISGLTAAVVLAKNGFNVTVYEKTSRPGGSHFGDFQFLENWTTEGDVLEFLKSIGLEVNFPYYEFSELPFYSPSLNEYKLKSDLPIAYLVKRGGEGSIDEGLARQAGGHSVKIEFRKRVFEKDVDIISTGPKKIVGFSFGANFKTDSDDRAMFLFDNILSPGSYSYFAAVDGRATIVCFSKPKTVKEHSEHLERIITEFQKIHYFSTEDKESFSGFSNFFLPKTAVKNGRIYTGEAAGFQDAFAGFGMRYAILSGYFAARAIIEELNYDKLWKPEFFDQMKTSLANKFIFRNIGSFSYEKLLNFTDYRALMKAIERGEDGRKTLRRQYKPSVSKKIALPLAIRSFDEYGKHQKV
ncbi:MAG: NAD(P)/FAD-dependent oxidoreductase [Candidatus Altiarchaeota archaeon]|nr:NAD(P)/FAD-dependent oxidoreductase [Candidatus Altiarchaeota archaeon]